MTSRQSGQGCGGRTASLSGFSGNEGKFTPLLPVIALGFFTLYCIRSTVGTILGRPTSWHGVWLSITERSPSTTGS